MFSKWWLPLFIIYYKDEYNYWTFYDSGSFNIFYKDMKNVAKAEITTREKGEVDTTTLIL